MDQECLVITTSESFSQLAFHIFIHHIFICNAKLYTIIGCGNMMSLNGVWRVSMMEFKSWAASFRVRVIYNRWHTCKFVEVHPFRSISQVDTLNLTYWIFQLVVSACQRNYGSLCRPASTMMFLLTEHYKCFLQVNAAIIKCDLLKDIHINLSIIYPWLFISQFHFAIM